MKRILISAIALLTVNAFADESGSSKSKITYMEYSKNDIHITPVVGVTAMGITGDNASTDMSAGGSYGGLVEIGSGLVTFQTGLEYNQFGGKRTFAGGSAETTLSYLSLPLVAKLNLMGNPEETVYLKAGVMPGTALTRSKRITGLYYSWSAEDEFKTTDIPAVVGVGGAIPMSSQGSLVLDLTFIRSLTSIGNNGLNAYNTGLVLSAGFSFAL